MATDADDAAAGVGPDVESGAEVVLGGQRQLKALDGVE